jgi:hypothetical protein
MWFLRVRVYHSVQCAPQLSTQWVADWPEDTEGATWTPYDQQGNPLPLVEEVEFLRCGNQSYRNRLKLWMKIAVRRQEERDAARAEVASVASERDDVRTTVIAQANDLDEAHAEVRALREQRESLRAGMAQIRVLSAAIARAEAPERERDEALRTAKEELDWQSLADYQMLGDPDMPGGQALRALVRAARAAWLGAALDRGIAGPSTLEIIIAMDNDDAWGDLWEAVQRRDGDACALFLAVLLDRQPPKTLGEAIDACAAAPEHDDLDTVGKRHTLTEEGDCVGWCSACRENRASGRNPDGTAPVTEGQPIEPVASSAENMRAGSPKDCIFSSTPYPPSAGKGEEICAGICAPVTEGRTCGGCQRGRGWNANGRGYCIGMGKVRADGRILPRRALHRDQIPPDDCPEFEPREGSTT